MEVSVLKKTIRIFSVFFPITPKELVSFESASGVESKYPVNPVQPLGRFGCRAAWKSGMAEKPVKRLVTAGKQGAYVLRRCLQPSAPCRNVDHRAGFKVLGIPLARLPLVPGHIDMGMRLLRWECKTCNYTRGIGSSPAHNHVCSISVQPPLVPCRERRPE